MTYGSRATQRMLDIGYELDELIDERYAQENDEGYKPVAVHAAAGAVDSAKQAADAFADKAAAAADTIVHDPDVRKFVEMIVFKAMETAAEGSISNG